MMLQGNRSLLAVVAAMIAVFVFAYAINLTRF